MVTINCGNYYISVFKCEYKTAFEKFQYKVNNTKGLWFQVDSLEGNRIVLNNQNDDNNNNNLIDEELINQTTLNIVEKFIKIKEDDITKIIEINLSFTNDLKNSDELILAAKRKQFYYENLFLNVELNLFYAREFIEQLFKSN